MANKHIFFIVVCFFLSLTDVQGLQTVNGRIKITVGTTSGSGDVVRFLPSLNEAYNLYKDFLDIEFIPWGRANRNADGSLNCQFGPSDCWANRLHRCTLSLLQGNLDAQMQYMNCEFTSPYPGFLGGSYVCPRAVGLNVVDVDYCVVHPNDDLDLEAERRGTEMIQAIGSVPTVVFNDNIDLGLHQQALVRLSSMICVALASDPTTGVTSNDCPV